jgi:hypothetical protein
VGCASRHYIRSAPRHASPVNHIHLLQALRGVGDWRASEADCDEHLCRNSLRGMWTPDDTKQLVASTAKHNPVPINGCLNDLKFGRNRVHHKVRMPRRRVLRNCRLSASTAFRTNQAMLTWSGIRTVWAHGPSERRPNFEHGVLMFVLGEGAFHDR